MFALCGTAIARPPVLASSDAKELLEVYGIPTARTVEAPTAAKAAELMKESVPQIKVVALIGASNLVTDQEVIEAANERGIALVFTGERHFRH